MVHHLPFDSLISFCRGGSRLLLSESLDDASTACPGGGNKIVDGIPQSSQGLLIISNVTLCAAGSSIISYDIGFLDQYGVFVPIVIDAFSTEVIVLIGEAAGFRLVVRESQVERSYSIVKSQLAVIVHDQGRNVSFTEKIVLICHISDAGGQWFSFVRLVGG